MELAALILLFSFTYIFPILSIGTFILCSILLCMDYIDLDNYLGDGNGNILSYNCINKYSS